MRATIALGALLVSAAGDAGGQALADRVAQVEGTAQIQFASRPAVCGDGRDFIKAGETQWIQSWDGWRDGRDRTCLPGPVRLVIDVRDGRVTRLRTHVGGTADARVTDLGTVSSADAGEFLLDLARSAPGRVGEDAILPLMLAEGLRPARDLLALARGRNVPKDTREEALEWLAREASAAAAGVDDWTLDPALEPLTDEEELRAHAIFVLSELPRDEGIPALIDVARTVHNPKLRGRALFWLGDSEDARALAVFEEMILGRRQPRQHDPR